MAPELTPIRSRLVTRELLSPVLFLSLEQRHWSDLSRAQAWAKVMEILGCPDVRMPLSALLTESNGKDEPIQLVSAQLQELPEGVTVYDLPP